MVHKICLSRWLACYMMYMQVNAYIMYIGTAALGYSHSVDCHIKI